ncbi:MAG: glycosyl transferase family 2 [Bacteroidota bacterium]
MDNSFQFSFIIQARSGSTRLPNKMNLPFYKDQTLLDIIIMQLLKQFSHSQIILATTNHQKDDSIVETGNKYKVKIYRGDEDNVLNRFIEAATFFKVENIIRVCADNPFIINEFIQQLIYKFTSQPVDYLSFQTHDLTPSIKTHFGFFTEITTLKTLTAVSKQTQDKLYIEHVTNYIYANPQIYSLKFEPIPVEIEKANIRLTVDTLDDFNVCKQIYSHLITTNSEISPKNIIKFIENNDYLKEVMLNQINLNKK